MLQHNAPMRLPGVHLPGVHWALDRMYGVFARNRVRLGMLFGRQCESGKCAIAPAVSDCKSTKSALLHK